MFQHGSNIQANHWNSNSNTAWVINGHFRCLAQRSCCQAKSSWSHFWWWQFSPKVSNITTWSILRNRDYVIDIENEFLEWQKRLFHWYRYLEYRLGSCPISMKNMDSHQQFAISFSHSIFCLQHHKDSLYLFSIVSPLMKSSKLSEDDGKHSVERRWQHMNETENFYLGTCTGK